MQDTNIHRLPQVYAASLHVQTSALDRVDALAQFTQKQRVSTCSDPATFRTGCYLLAEFLDHKYETREQMIMTGEQEYFELISFFPIGTTPLQMFEYLKHQTSQSVENQMSIF